MKKINEMMINGSVKMDMFLSSFSNKIKNKLSETCGADGSTEKTGWIIGALVIAGSVIFLIKKFAPELGDMVMDKIKEFFSFATVS